ncbi:MAG: NADH-quinone oxidoreductase subunit J [Chloroflexi bacterium]|nr:NADH-quinone oxidoreductase subunit J [Chloroflexota bacterium]
MAALDIAFWVMAGVGVASALAVVLLKDMFRAALFLVISFLVVAGLFVLLNAEFLAVVQVLIYVGAISILIIFAIMLTRNVHEGNPSNRFQLPALVLAAMVLTAIAFVVVNTEWNSWDRLGFQVLPGDTGEVSSHIEQGIKDVFGNATVVIARLILREFVLPMEVASVVLLAAVIGALALVREREDEL